jgi:CubicO group peptidase (beta-lactamase class C family)
VPGLSGDAGLVSTIEDYARFAEMFANGGGQPDRKIISSTAVGAMMSNQLKSDQLSEMPASA